MSSVYLLHFSRPYPGGRRPQHYLGVALDVAARLLEHKAGSSKSRLTQACKLKRIAVELVRQWKFDSAHEAFNFERRLKRRKKSYKTLCPYCKKGN